MDDRNYTADMMALADLFFRNLQRDDLAYGGWGLDGKRPFGFSGRYAIAGDILEAIGVAAAGDAEYTDEQYQYAHDLYSDLGTFLAHAWDSRWKDQPPPEE